MMKEIKVMLKNALDYAINNKAGIFTTEQKKMAKKRYSEILKLGTRISDGLRNIPVEPKHVTIKTLTTCSSERWLSEFYNACYSTIYAVNALSGPKPEEWYGYRDQVLALFGYASPMPDHDPEYKQPDWHKEAAKKRKADYEKALKEHNKTFEPPSPKTLEVQDKKVITQRKERRVKQAEWLGIVEWEVNPDGED